MAVNRVVTFIGSEERKTHVRSVGATARNGHYQYRATIIIASIKMDVFNITDTMHCTITTRRIFLLVTYRKWPPTEASRRHRTAGVAWHGLRDI
jgi:hypothetical protein